MSCCRLRNEEKKYIETKVKEKKGRKKVTAERENEKKKRIIFDKEDFILKSKNEIRLVLLRRRYDISIKRHGGLPLRRLGDVPSRRSWVFHLRRTYNVAGTYRDMSLQRHNVLLPVEK